MPEFEKFNISQVGILIRDNKCLILEFSQHPGRWGLPGGRIDKGELGEEAFKRELREEIGFDDVIIHELIDYDIFYVNSVKPMCGIVQYIENKESEIILSEEHSQYKWIAEDEIDDYNLVWDNLPRMMRKGFEYHRNKIKNNSRD